VFGRDSRVFSARRGEDRPQRKALGRARAPAFRQRSIVRDLIIELVDRVRRVGAVRQVSLTVATMQIDSY
jgi:hypothetical protein